MTTITICNKYIKVKGHSGYAEYGKDIVCSAISTLVEATYNYLVATGNEIEIIEDEALYIIKVKEPYVFNQAGNQIFAAFQRMISELEKQYPDYIKVNNNL